MELLTVQQGDAAFRKLMASPISAPRKRIRRSKAPAEQFAHLGASLADIWAKSPRGKRAKPSPLGEKIPTYADWLRFKCKMKGEDVKSEVARANAEWAMRNELDRIASHVAELQPEEPEYA